MTLILKFPLAMVSTYAIHMCKSGMASMLTHKTVSLLVAFTFTPDCKYYNIVGATIHIPNFNL